MPSRPARETIARWRRSATPRSARTRRPSRSSPTCATTSAARARVHLGQRARRSSTGCPAGAGLNIAHEAVDRHAAGPRATASRCAGSARRATAADVTYARAARGRRTASPTCSRRSASAAASGSSRCSAGSPSSTSPCSARSSTAASSARCSPPSGPSRSASGCALGDGARARHDAGAVPRARSRRIRDALPDLEHVLLVGDAGDRVDRARCDLDALLAAAAPTLRDRADRPRGHGAAALHQRHDRHARRAPSTCTRRSSPTTPPARYALDLHPDDVFWCTADPGWVTGTSYGIIAPLTHGVTSVVDEGEFDAERWYRILADAAGHRLVHGADRDPHADAGRRRAGRSEHDLSRAALHRQRRRAAQPGGGRLGRGGARPADPRQLVADRDRRDHDRQLRGDGHPARARWAGRCPASRPRSLRARRRRASSCCATARRCESTSRARRASSRCGRAGRRCSAATCTSDERYRALLRRRLVPHRRPRPPRRRRLLLVRRPRRRRDQVGRPPDRPVRGRERR